MGDTMVFFLLETISMSIDFTPMMIQYLGIKEKQKDAILFFRLGDFYEMFFDDAVEASKLLNITLTSRGKTQGKRIPMCGIPHHAANNYIARLVRQGKKVAICEQIEEPVPGKKIVERDIVKIITPGTFMADELVDGAVNNYILSLNADDDVFGLAYADISTGEFRITEIDNDEDFFSELYKISPAECLISKNSSNLPRIKKLKDINLGLITISEDWMFDPVLSEKEIKRHFSVESLEGYGCANLDLAVGAAGALLKYLKDTQKNSLGNINHINTYCPCQFMSMDRNSQRHLELIHNQEDLSTKGTLFNVLDMTRTPMGKRKLKKWILNPLLDVIEINKRLDAVEYFFSEQRTARSVKELLEGIYDIERLSNKMSLGTATGRDLVSLALSFENVEKLKTCFVLTTNLAQESDGCTKNIPELINQNLTSIGDLKDIISWIQECLVDVPPVSLKDGGLVRKGYDKDIDELHSLVASGKDWLAELQKKEIERTGINSLKVGFNKIFGYYIEVTNSNLDAVPSDYIRKQTLVNAERFITQSLKEYESKIIGAEERLRNMEYETFCRLRDKIGCEIDRLKKTAEAISELDVLLSLGRIAVANRYARPEITDNDQMRIIEGRHPVLEKVLKDKQFVPNDVCMNSEEDKIFIITGSNMAGKSTFIRQTALIVVMAQIGSFVPAKEAEIGVLDRIFTRVGASDRLYHGMSTFMVEMLETANILNNATGKSLIILDEVGRGTSTFDGVSIAWAVVEFICQKLSGARVMFATHYHELTELASIMAGVKNYHLAVQEWKDEIVFLYKVADGSCDDSFGIHVAKLAGMPHGVVKRAREILNNLQKDSFLGNIRSRFFSDKENAMERQFDFFDRTKNKEHPVVTKLQSIDVNSMTPLEALKRLAELKDEAGGE
ncbi:MAG: DNA mismatch repair protein MutS [Candidatus Omnitrophota bacterium]